MSIPGSSPDGRARRLRKFVSNQTGGHWHPPLPLVHNTTLNAVPEGDAILDEIVDRLVRAVDLLWFTAKDAENAYEVVQAPRDKVRGRLPAA